MPQNNKISLFMKDKGFYVVLALCIVGASAAAWVTANKTLDSIEENNKKIVEQSVSGEEKIWKDDSPGISLPDTTAPVEQPVSEAEKPLPSSSSQPPASSSSGNTADSVAGSGQSKQQQSSPALSYVLPLDSLGVITPYSGGELVKNKTLNVWRTHDGVDLKGEKGAAVKAVADGVVEEIRVDPLWGGMLVLSHSDGHLTTYCGVTADKSLKEDSQVKAGQQLGTVSEIPAEISMESHIHLTFQKDGKYVDPGTLLPLKGENP